MVVATTKLEEIILQQCDTCWHWRFIKDTPHPWGHCNWEPCEEWPFYVVRFYKKYTDFNQGHNCKAWKEK